VERWGRMECLRNRLEKWLFLALCARQTETASFWRRWEYPAPKQGYLADGCRLINKASEIGEVKGKSWLGSWTLQETPFPYSLGPRR
jgi:hypothetical protein